MFSDIDYSLIVLQLEKAMANGVATLDSNTKVPKAQISLTASDVGAIASTGNEVLTSLNAASGTISSGLLPSYVDDVLNYTNLAGFPGTGETGKIYVDETTNKVYRWSGSVYVEISSSATAGEALKLTNARTISTTGDITGSISGFDGSANVSGVMTLQTVNSNVGSFGSVSAIPVVTVNAKGQVTAVSTNSIGNELIALQALSDTPGFLKKTGDGTYLIDVNSYLSLTGGTITGDLVSTSATTSTSPTTGAIRAASLGITGAIFADTISANSYNLIPVGRGAGGVGSNTVIGVNSLLANTTGANLTAVGVNSLLANTTGNSLTAVGLDSLRVNTSGSNLTAVGVGSLQNNTTGNSSTAVGVGALFSNATGSSLVGFGVNAGRFIADGVTGLTASNTSCFIGASTKGTQNATNENVFGFNATGNGSNTVTIGDNNIVRTYLKGVVDVANTTPSTSTTTGGLVVSGGVGVGGSIFAGNINVGGTAIVVSSNQFNGFVVSNSAFTVAQLQGSTATNDIGTLTLRSANVPTVSLTASGNSHLNGGSLGIGNTNPSHPLDVTGIARASSFRVGANQIIGSRITGWVAPTGTATRTTFATSTVTLPQLAERVKALIDDLTTHGLIGA